MIIKYIPTGKCYTLKEPTMREIINQTDRISPMEQSQYKRFEFCVNPAERHTVMCYFKGELSVQSGVPLSKVLKHQPKVSEIYIAEIGHIKFT